MVRRAAWALPLLCIAGCHSKVDALRDDLLEGRPASAGAPECSEATTPACLTTLAKSLGSEQEFDPINADQAAAGAAAIVLLRERRGDLVPGGEHWLRVLRLAKG